ncbi:urease accessory protein UreD [Romeria aff. gracilis LEGE 07310]|uniref:Urease accessory protein UreD n=1 Tax=Vasconcelosia minhoensis LEGE 07310 TaxID=915328 RepID=A0A8J7DBZ7_9CYAN|nr:urease accessory protein UreD [Romeria gracilis]MBE9077138.1 urease accessory protein UreD [Romeria aff. gracilis LEGE 07310]
MVIVNDRNLITTRPQLELQIGCDRNFQSFISHQYAAYPFRLSRCFRLDTDRPQRAYLYLMNASPGLLAQDRIETTIKLNDFTQLYLTDQAALKVHSMPASGTSAQVVQHIQIGKKACLEYVPEPIILYADAEFNQRSRLTLHPTGQLFWSEIILPGRLARQEWYQFRHYRSRLQVVHSDGTPLFTDAMFLAGQTNPFKDRPLFSALPAIANLITVLPETDLTPLTDLLSSHSPSVQRLQAEHSRLPNCNGLLIRAIADSASTLKAYIHFVLNQIRQLTQQALLPEVPK